ncbi:MAG: hypothetical protein ACLT8E_12610 [Akkermansia sp.]
MIVAKCRHDMDILYWLMGRRKCLSVASRGAHLFTKKRSPPRWNAARMDHPGGRPWDAQIRHGRRMQALAGDGDDRSRKPPQRKSANG